MAFDVRTDGAEEPQTGWQCSSAVPWTGLQTLAQLSLEGSCSGPAIIHGELSEGALLSLLCLGHSFGKLLRLRTRGADPKGAVLVGFLCRAALCAPGRIQGWVQQRVSTVPMAGISSLYSLPSGDCGLVHGGSSCCPEPAPA